MSIKHDNGAMPHGEGSFYPAHACPFRLFMVKVDNISEPGDAEMKNITLCVYSLSQWALMSRLCNRLAADGRFRVSIVYFGGDTSVRQRIADAAAGANAGFADFESMAASAAEYAVPPRGQGARLDMLMPFSHSYRALLRRQKQAAHQILDDMQTDVLVVVEDGPGGNAAMIAMAREGGIPVLVVPYGIGESKDYDVFLADKHREGNLNFLPSDSRGDFIRKQAAHWVRPTEYGEVLLFPVDFVLARLAEGLDLPRPWAVQGGHADWIAVESAKMREHYVREGISEHKLVDLGTLYCDTVSDVLNASPECRQAFETGGKIRDGHTSILIALPPSYHDIRGHLCEFPTYEAMCLAVVNYCCGLPDTQVTVSVHPNTQPRHVEVLRAAGAQIADEWIVALIPQNDIFLTDFSSTIRWAIAARKMTINYDIYQFRLETYLNTSTVFSSTVFDDVCNELKRLVTGDAEYRKRVAEVSPVSQSWGIIDGQAYDRLSGFIDDLHKKKSARVTENAQYAQRSSQFEPFLQSWGLSGGQFWRRLFRSLKRVPNKRDKLRKNVF